MKKYTVWYAIWVNDERTITLLRKTKKAARTCVRDLRKDFPDYTFGWKRLIEQASRPRRRRRGEGTTQSRVRFCIRMVQQQASDGIYVCEK